MTVRASQLLQSYPMITHSILPQGCTFSCELNDSVPSLSSDRDLLELKKLKIHKNCNIVPVSILPLLPSLNLPSPASSPASTFPNINSPTKPSCTDDVCNSHHIHLTPPALSSGEGHSDLLSSLSLVFHSSLDPADPVSPLTPTQKRLLSPVRTCKMAQHFQDTQCSHLKQCTQSSRAKGKAKAVSIGSDSDKERPPVSSSLNHCSTILLPLSDVPPPQPCPQHQSHCVNNWRNPHTTSPVWSP